MARGTDALGEAWGPDGTQPSRGPGDRDALRAPDVGGDATAPGEGASRPTSRVRSATREVSPPGAHPTRGDGDALGERNVPGDRNVLGEGDALGPVPMPRLPAVPSVDDPSSRAALQRWMDDDRAAHDDDPPVQPHRVLPPTRPSAPPARRPVDRDMQQPRRERDDERNEDPTVRAQREEREFEAQFGQWRAPSGATPPMRRSTLVSPPVLLLTFVLLVVLYYAVIH